MYLSTRNFSLARQDKNNLEVIQSIHVRIITLIFLHGSPPTLHIITNQ